MAQPWRVQALFQYLDFIYRAYTDFAGQVWLQYDQVFHMQSAIYPNMHWDRPQSGLWLQHMTPARPNIGDRFDSGHFNRKMATTQTPHPGTWQAVQPRLPCFEYNSGGGGLHEKAM